MFKFKIPIIPAGCILIYKSIIILYTYTSNCRLFCQTSTRKSMIAFGSHYKLRNSKTIFSLLDSVVNQVKQYPRIPIYSLTAIIFTMRSVSIEGRCDFRKNANANVENKRKT